MRKFGYCFAFCAAVLLVIAYFFDSNGCSFWSGLIQNLCAEAAGIGAVLIITSYYAESKLRKLASPVGDFIQNLREAGKIDGNTARAMMVFAVKVLSEDFCLQIKAGELKQQEYKGCRICGLEYISAGTDGAKCCSHCKLPVRLIDNG